MFFISCNVDDIVDSCDYYQDLCADYPSGVSYEICIDNYTYDTYYKVGGTTYYTSSYMINRECNF